MNDHGVAIALTPCWVHGGVFEADPDHVCTVYIDSAGRVVDPEAVGARQVAICDPCMKLVNEERAKLDLPAFELAEERARRWGSPA